MLTLLILVGAIGFGAWLFITLVPLPQPWPRVIVGVAGFIVFVLLVQLLMRIVGAGGVNSLRL